MRSCMRSLFSLSLGNEGGGVELVYAGHLFAGVEVYFDMRKIGVLSIFSLFFDVVWLQGFWQNLTRSKHFYCA